MSNARVPGPIGSGSNFSTLDDGTLRRSLSYAPGVLGGASSDSTAPFTTRPPLLPTSQGSVKPPSTVQFGSRGPLIQRLQRLLNERISPSLQLAINGTFDAATLAAVKQYQQYLRLTVDGRVGRDTWYRLHKGDTAVIPGAPTMVAKPVALTKATISAWTLEQKFTRVMQLTPPKLPGHMRQEFMALLDPTALALIVGTLIIWGAAHAFGVGVIVDIALLISGVVFLGMAAIDAAGHLYDFLILTSTADEESDLDQAAVMLAKAVAILGVSAFAALVTKGAVKRGVKKVAMPEQKPLMKDPGKKVAREDQKVEDTKHSDASKPVSKSDGMPFKHEVTRTLPAREANSGFEKPPYRDGTKVAETVLKEDTIFVRLYDGDKSGQLGRWMMPIDEVKGLSPEQIRSKFALPQAPTNICEVNVPTGTTLRFGEAGPISGWGPGGGTQIQLMDRIPAASYVNPRGFP